MAIYRRRRRQLFRPHTSPTAGPAAFPTIPLGPVAMESSPATNPQTLTRTLRSSASTAAPGRRQPAVVRRPPTAGDGRSEAFRSPQGVRVC
jgi:hypothetical protein